MSGKKLEMPRQLKMLEALGDRGKHEAEHITEIMQSMVEVEGSCPKAIEEAEKIGDILTSEALDRIMGKNVVSSDAAPLQRAVQYRTASSLLQAPPEGGSWVAFVGGNKARDAGRGERWTSFVRDPNRGRGIQTLMRGTPSNTARDESRPAA